MLVPCPTAMHGAAVLSNREGQQAAARWASAGRRQKFGAKSTGSLLIFVEQALVAIGAKPDPPVGHRPGGSSSTGAEVAVAIQQGGDGLEKVCAIRHQSAETA